MKRKELSCKEFEKLMFDYIRGDLEPSVRESVEAHLSSCPSCRLKLEKEMRIERLLSDGFEQKAPLREIRNRVFDRIEAERRPFAFVKNAWKLAPAVALAFSIIAFFLMFGRSQDIEAEEIEIKTAIVAPADNDVVLPDEVEFVVVAPKDKRFSVSLIVDGEVVPLEQKAEGLMIYKPKEMEAGYHLVELIVRDSKTGLEVERESVFYVFGEEGV
ncbi:MAG: hypothetical protein DRQ10_01225 [Candidatus Hydrothermota bacterium]|nr:MAG: hypothetical protein DRQ10_01225 [Candidatus Hydrothermae bacterium]